MKAAITIPTSQNQETFPGLDSGSGVMDTPVAGSTEVWACSPVPPAVAEDSGGFVGSIIGLSVAADVGVPLGVTITGVSVAAG